MDNDSSAVQMQRLKELVETAMPGVSVEFYSNNIQPGTSDIRFRLRDVATNKILGKIAADDEWDSSEVADLDNQRLLERIRKLIL